MARSWLGITLIVTTVASRPMMTITTISSTSVKPAVFAALPPGRLNPVRRCCVAGLRAAVLRQVGVRVGVVAGFTAGFMTFSSTKDERIELQDRQQDREHDHRDHAAE